MDDMKPKSIIPFLILAVLTACQPGATAAPVQTAIPSGTEVIETMTEPSNDIPTVLSPLPADPQVIRFTASDGQELTGTYYPAKTNPAPLIVLMHWIRSDQTDWATVAVWLQNRGVPDGIANPAGTWQDGSWFPELPDDFSIGVFIFTFRGCLPNKRCPNFDGSGWLLDAQAALQKAATLEGVDPARIITAGASIGADGAVDTCALANRTVPGSCRGAFVLSPGSYLGMSYPTAVQQLQSPASGAAMPVWCLADENEISICEQGEGETYRSIEVKGGGHGMSLIAPDLDPQALDLLIEFIQQTVE